MKRMHSSLASLRASYATNLRPHFGGDLFSRSAKLGAGVAGLTESTDIVASPSMDVIASPETIDNSISVVSDCGVRQPAVPRRQ
jgi:hypothetical protein